MILDMPVCSRLFRHAISKEYCQLSMNHAPVLSPASAFLCDINHGQISCFMSSPAPYPSFPPQRGENSLISLLLLFPLNPLGPGHLLLAYANSPCRWASVGTLTLSSVNSRTPAQIRPNSFGRCLFPQRLEKPHTAAPVAKHGLVFAVSPLPFDAL